MMRLAVVGGGIMGVSAAYAAAKRGDQVTLYERTDLANERGSSHGNSRIVRKTYPDAFHTSLMLEAYPKWADLDRSAGGGILHEVGLLYLGSESDPAMREVGENLSGLHVSHQRLAFGQHAYLHEGEIGFLTAEAGWVHAERAVRALWTLAGAYGAKLEFATISDPTHLLREHDLVLLAPGAWIREFVPLEVEVRCMTLAYVRGTLHGPVWIEEGPNYLYGFPSEPGRNAFKVGVHAVGLPCDPNSPDREPDSVSLDLVRDLARRRFGIPDPEIESIKTCLYTVTPDEEFRFGKLSDQVWYLSACSGHGFKFGPWLGEALVEILAGTREGHALDRLRQDF